VVSCLYLFSGCVHLWSVVYICGVDVLICGRLCLFVVWLSLFVVGFVYLWSGCVYLFSVLFFDGLVVLICGRLCFFVVSCVQLWSGSKQQEHTKI